MSKIKVGDFWIVNDDDNLCEITNVSIEEGVIWVESYSARDDASDSDTLDDFLRNYTFSHKKGSSAKPKHSHYKKDVRHIDTIDIYVICDLYVKDNSGCIQHAVKKLLCCGNRGVKDNVRDLQEAIDTIQRKIEILQGKSE